MLLDAWLFGGLFVCLFVWLVGWLVGRRCFFELNHRRQMHSIFFSICTLSFSADFCSRSLFSFSVQLPHWFSFSAVAVGLVKGKGSAKHAPEKSADEPPALYVAQVKDSGARVSAYMLVLINTFGENQGVDALFKMLRRDAVPFSWRHLLLVLRLFNGLDRHWSQSSAELVHNLLLEVLPSRFDSLTGILLISILICNARVTDADKV